jgi:SAM-dependent methyltransferase
VLELGCGTGTILREIVGRIHDTGADAIRAVGVDLSEGMLTVARRHAPHITFVDGDMRSPPVDGPFDLVFSCYNSLQSLPTAADLAQTFEAVRELLSPTGVFAFDIYQPNIPYLEIAARDRLARTIVAPDGRHLEIREDSQFVRSSQLLTIDWRLIDVDAAGRQIAATRYQLRQFFPSEVEALLSAAGLAISQRYGDLDRSPFDATSRKQVLVCRADDSA